MYAFSQVGLHMEQSAVTIYSHVKKINQRKAIRIKQHA